MLPESQLIKALQSEKREPELARIKELAMANCLMDAELILTEAKELKGLLALEVQAARDDRRAQQKEFKEFMAHLWDFLVKLQARFHIDAQLLNLIKPDDAGETQWPKEKNSDRCHMLDILSKKTH